MAENHVFLSEGIKDEGDEEIVTEISLAPDSAVWYLIYIPTTKGAMASLILAYFLCEFPAYGTILFHAVYVFCEKNKITP